MSDAVAALESMLSHPCPGLVFGVHEYAGVGERAIATPHRASGPMTPEEREKIERLAASHPSELRPLLDAYARWNGIDLCSIREDDIDAEAGALRLLPVREWDAETAPWLPGGEAADFMQGVTMYTCGTWRVIGTLSSEGMSLVLFFDGEYEGQPLAGRMFCIGLDGLLGYEEELAPGFAEFIAAFIADPAAFFERVGYAPTVSTDRGHFGDPVAAYVADVRNHPSYVG